MTRQKVPIILLQLRVSRKYTWSLREETEAGAPLTDVIQHGIGRINHASDCLAVVLKELKEQACAGKFRLYVSVDLVNSFYRPTNIRRQDCTGVQVCQTTMGKAFKKMFLNDWV